MTLSIPGARCGFSILPQIDSSLLMMDWNESSSFSTDGGRPVHREIQRKYSDSQCEQLKWVLRRKRRKGASRGRDLFGKPAIVEAGVAEAQFAETAIVERPLLAQSGHWPQCRRPKSANNRHESG